jgi:hypothetical protein
VSAQIVPISAATGPRSAQGKRIVSLNALRHGLYAETVVIRGLEDRDDYLRFARQVIVDLDVQGVLEMALAERVISALWRLRRVRRFESETLSTEASKVTAIQRSADAIAENIAIIERRRDAIADVASVDIKVVECAVFEDAVSGIQEILRTTAPNVEPGSAVVRMLDRGKPIRGGTAAKAVDEWRARLPATIKRASLGEFAWFCYKTLNDAVDMSRSELDRTRCRAAGASVLALQLDPDAARVVSDAEARLDRQVSRALDDFYKCKNASGGSNHHGTSRG